MNPQTANVLHVTNGSAACDQLRNAGIAGEYLPWDDPLHQGPVLGDLQLRDHSAIRAKFVAECGWESVGEAERRFSSRDARLHQQQGEIVLWSSPELYDQLHLLQILSWLSTQATRNVSVVWLSFLFSDHSPENLVAAFRDREPVTAKQVDVATTLWAIFGSNRPDRLSTQVSAPVPELPYMQTALQRFLAEFPHVETGVSQTQLHALTIMSERSGIRPGQLFRAASERENIPFMGDWSFWMEIAEMTQGNAPLARCDGGEPFVYPPQTSPEDPRFAEQSMVLTGFGRRVLARQADWLMDHVPNKWLGGTHLRSDNLWRFNPESAEVVAWNQGSATM